MEKSGEELPLFTFPAKGSLQRKASTELRLLRSEIPTYYLDVGFVQPGGLTCRGKCRREGIEEGEGEEAQRADFWKFEIHTSSGGLLQIFREMPETPATSIMFCSCEQNCLTGHLKMSRLDKRFPNIEDSSLQEQGLRCFPALVLKMLLGGAGRGYQLPPSISPFLPQRTTKEEKDGTGECIFTM